MARISVDGLEAAEMELMKESERAAKAIPRMVNAGGDVLADYQKREVKAMFGSRRSTGALAASIKKTAVKTKGSAKYVEVYPHGKDSHGVSNATKGFVLNYGRSNMPARPWVNKAYAAAERQVTDAIRKAWEDTE